MQMIRWWPNILAALRGDQQLVPVSLTEMRQGTISTTVTCGATTTGGMSWRLLRHAGCRGLDDFEIAEGIDSFKGLAHRMEYVGEFHGIDFYNDSIATIPEACMAALSCDTPCGHPRTRRIRPGHGLRTAGHVPLCLRGAELHRYGDGRRKDRMAIKKWTSGKRLVRIHRFDEFLPHALKYTAPGRVCLLSPAAASYDEFRSFEERGMRFAELVSTGTP